jgi:hypothetical protein
VGYAAADNQERHFSVSGDERNVTRSAISSCLRWPTAECAREPGRVHPREAARHA